MPRSSIGECVPDVTSPPPSIVIPWRGTAFSSMTNETSLRSGPRALSSRRSPAPETSFSTPQHHPTPAETPSVPAPLLVRQVENLGARNPALLQPGGVSLAVGRVPDEQEAETIEPVDDQVVDDSAAVVCQEGVLGLAGADLVEIVREGRLQQRSRARA